MLLLNYQSTHNYFKSVYVESETEITLMKLI